VRPITKLVLVLLVVALAGGVLYFAGRKWGKDGHAQVSDIKPPAEPLKAAKPAYNDPVATYQRWRDRLSKPAEPEPPAPHNPLQRDLTSTSRNEGTVVARHLSQPVAGADPPGPFLRPGSDVVGELITKPWNTADVSGNTYTVASGDTLYDIALKHYGDSRYVPFIEAANPGVDARSLKVGMRIVLPERQSRETVGDGTAALSPPPAPQGKVYVIQRNDTLIGIARRFYGDAAAYRKIYEANKDVLSSPNATLHVGMRLRMPQ
jgi:nucleoid-associated protein YgaU